MDLTTPRRAKMGRHAKSILSTVVFLLCGPNDSLGGTPDTLITSDKGAFWITLKSGPFLSIIAKEVGDDWFPVSRQDGLEVVHCSPKGLIIGLEYNHKAFTGELERGSFGDLIAHNRLQEFNAICLETGYWEWVVHVKFGVDGYFVTEELRGITPSGASLLKKNVEAHRTYGMGIHLGPAVVIPFHFGRIPLGLSLGWNYRHQFGKSEGISKDFRLTSGLSLEIGLSFRLQ